MANCKSSNHRRNINGGCRLIRKSSLQPEIFPLSLIPAYTLFLFRMFSQEKLEFLGRKVRKKNSPFGGIQLLVTGDFFQLPPVSKGSEQKKFAFEAACWASCFHLQTELTEVFRQSDSEFVALLNEIRRGNCCETTMAKLGRCRGYQGSQDGVIMTRLYPHKVNASFPHIFSQDLVILLFFLYAVVSGGHLAPGASQVDVSRENEQNLNKLREDELHFMALDVGRSEYGKKLLENTRAEKLIRLKKGAQVMLIKVSLLYGNW